jgi:cytochrome c peroxidase
LNSYPQPYSFEEVSNFPTPTNNPKNLVTIEGVKLGRHLFYDSILSEDYSISCASCHQQKFAFSDTNQLAKGINGSVGSRNVLPLFNLNWSSNFFWDGRASTVEEQAFLPVSNHLEMNLKWTIAEQRVSSSPLYQKLFSEAFPNQKIDSTLICFALAQFERTIISNNSKYDSVINGLSYFSSEEYKGFLLVNDQEGGDCFHCHITDAHGLGTNGRFSNNGLDLISEDHGLMSFTQDSSDLGKFRIPTLRNLAFTGPYMHDGRFSTLEEVLEFYSEGVQPHANIDSKMQHVRAGGVQLTEYEKKCILAFLNTLNDYSLLTNPSFSNPF